MSTHVADAGPPGHINYYHNSPWFLLLDHNGNVVRDTIYTSLFLNGVNPCGTLYKDNSGGYIHIGNYDSVYHNDPDDVKSFPSYIAHLDTNFRITWITSFSYTNEAGRRQSIALHQLSDSSYLLFGDTYKDHLPFSSGWAARISRTGEIIWSNDYHSDNHNDSYFRGAAQRADGSLVIVGASYNDTLSTWHRLMDMWIVGIDSNGCETMSCALAAPPGLPQGDEVLLYPNPTSGSFTIACPDDGVAELYNMQGQHVAHYAVKKGNTEISLPKNLAAGVYVCRYVPANGGVPVVVRVVYEP
ncbi:MAG: T9SS type A sorting domain-containing protein [Bacteroidota bacterium]